MNKYHPQRYDAVLDGLKARVNAMRAVTETAEYRAFMAGKSSALDMSPKLKWMYDEGESCRQVQDHIAENREVEIERHQQRLCGDNIFDVSRLAGMFVLTDVGDIDVRHLNTPYRSAYMHFGEGAGLVVGDAMPDAYIDGCYVRQEIQPGTGRCVGFHALFVCQFNGRGEESLGQVVSRESVNASAFIDGDLTISQSLEKWPPGGSIALCENLLLMDPAIRMLVNSLCYLGTQNADVETGWDEGAPADLVERAGRPNKGDAEKWASKLRAQGYTRVHFCGRNVAIPGENEVDEFGNPMMPHWRRGHYRSQPYGERSALRRSKWIMPTIVNRHLGPPVNGRIYEVEYDPERTLPVP